MKKLLSLLLVVFAVSSSVCISAYALPVSSGIDALASEFLYGKGPVVDGYTIDYRYYAPVKEGGNKKYPVIIWAHGHSHGQYDGYQIKSNSIANWSSDEYQLRFSEVGGFYLLAVRAPEDRGISWGENLTKPLKYAIDDFILRNIDTVDTTRIYMGGFSMGGMMTFYMCREYPEMFAAVFPVCPHIILDSRQAQKFSMVPVWLVAGVNDPLVNYEEKTLVNWKAVTSTTSLPAECRFSSLDPVCNPDGTATPTEHYSWESVTHDMFSYANGDYPYLTTVNAQGEKVTLAYPDGMISWLSRFTSEYSAEDIDISDTGSDTLNLNFFERIKAFIMKIYIILRNLIRPVTG